MSGQAVSRCPGLLEVVGDNGAHYRAFLVDIYDPDDPCILNNVPPTAEASDQVTVTVRFEKDWCPNRVLPLSRIRLPPTTGKNDGKAVNGDENLAIKEGDQVEILSPAKDNEGEGWWKSRVYMVKGDFFIVSDTSESSNHKFHDQNYSEIVTKDKIRPINTNPYLTSNPFYKFVIDVPKDVLKACGPTFAQSETHRLFRSALNLFAVNYDDRQNRLVCIGLVEQNKRYWFEKTVKSAGLLVDLHWRSLREYFEKKEQIQSLRSQLTNVDEVIKSGEGEYEVMVKVENHLMGYAIGQRGANIHKALKVFGVKTVDRVPVDENENMFKITGTNSKAVKLAKEIIQIMEVVVEIPRDIVSHVIGKHGQLVQEVTDRSGLIIINVKGDDPNGPTRQFVPFHLIGTREAIENAKILIDFHISCVKENLEIDKQLALKRNEIKQTIN